VSFPAEAADAAFLVIDVDSIDAVLTGLTFVCLRVAFIRPGEPGRVGEDPRDFFTTLET